MTHDPKHVHTLNCTECLPKEVRNPSPTGKAVSADWVLNQLAGMKFPNQGEAYDFMQRCLDAQPQFEHYCHECVHLGPYKYAGTEFDLYYCEPNKSVYARYGNVVGEMLAARLDQGVSQNFGAPLWHAKRQAKRQGLIP